MSDITVVLADDQELVRAGLRVILDSEPGIHVVGEAADGREALAAVADFAPDVVCMDVQMPELDGLEATRRLVASGSSTAVLMITTFDHDDYLFDALRAGASGFLLKTSSAEKLIEGVTCVARGESLLSPDVTRRVIERATGQWSAAPSDKIRDLTVREHEVLALVAQGMTNSEIAAALFLGEATVKSHVSSVLQKLQLRDRVQAVVFAYENGVAVPGD